MLKGGHNEPGQNGKEKADAALSRKDGGVCVGGRAGRSQRRMPSRKHCPSATVAVEAKISSRRSCKFERDQARSKAAGRSRDLRTKSRDRTAIPGSARNLDRTAVDEKKESLGLEGPLYGRHLTKTQRESLRDFISEAGKSRPIAAICRALEIHPRSYYRWVTAAMSDRHGGGGGLNKIRPIEETRVVNLAKKHPDWRCRRITYHLEKTAKVFIGKTRVAEILKAHELNHPFERGAKRPVIEPADMLLHEPWRKNLLWGMDWTWVTVDGKFMFLLVLLDWYSRKILSWGLYRQITKLQVVTVVTEAVATEQIDLLPKEEMRPTVVADHGSANTAEYTKSNIEIQGLKLWLSGIGRPTGNARTERVIGTLKREEINLQEQYANETEGKQSIKNAIWDYNFNRPNQGNGGFSPNSVHHMGRWELMKRRARARQKAEELRRNHWEQETSPSTDSLT